MVSNMTKMVAVLQYMYEVLVEKVWHVLLDVPIFFMPLSILHLLT